MKPKVVKIYVVFLFLRFHNGMCIYKFMYECMYECMHVVNKTCED